MLANARNIKLFTYKETKNKRLLLVKKQGTKQLRPLCLKNPEGLSVSRKHRP